VTDTPAGPRRPRLSDATLGDLPAAVARPRYDRRAVRAGIVHLGLGAFHRAHQAVFADDALGAGETGWGITAVSLRSPATRDALTPQDGLYGFALRDGETTRVRVIGSLARILVAPEAPEAVVAAIADPATRLVTLTITEKGYGLDLSTRRLDPDDPGVRADLAGTRPPATAVGILAEGLRHRRANGAPPPAIVSCDNLPANGAALRGAVTAFAAVRDEALAAWIDEAVSFPSSMVDRIVPATTDADREAVAAITGLDDAWPVLAEPAFDWIVEDRFRYDRPPFEASGVRFVADVEPFEQMKLRLLNGAHTAIAAIGLLAGYGTVPETVADPRVRAFLARHWAEAEATLAIDPRESAAYRDRLLPRFSNPMLPHKVAQIATDASLKVPQRLLAPLRRRLDEGREADALVLAVAAWIESCRGIDDAGRPFTVNDPLLDRWTGRPPASAGPEATVAAFLSLGAVFGADQPDRPDLRAALVAACRTIRERGVLAVLADRFPPSNPGD
jgi:fructuronate reductase